MSHSPEVGQTLSVAARDNLLLQWLREDPSDTQVHVISGAVRHQVCCTLGQTDSVPLHLVSEVYCIRYGCTADPFRA